MSSTSSARPPPHRQIRQHQPAERRLASIAELLVQRDCLPPCRHAGSEVAAFEHHTELRVLSPSPKLRRRVRSRRDLRGKPPTTIGPAVDRSAHRDAQRGDPDHATRPRTSPPAGCRARAAPPPAQRPDPACASPPRADRSAADTMRDERPEPTPPHRQQQASRRRTPSASRTSDTACRRPQGRTPPATCRPAEPTSRSHPVQPAGQQRPPPP